jgi:uncharacterized phage protein (TIGR01671 family)
MNRPIKFRFWGDFGDFNEEADTCEKEMLYGDRFHFFDHAPINNLFADKRFVVMQFTGLLDKNGKEIYEGDILKSLGTDICVVRWIDKLACFMLENINPKEDFNIILSELHRCYEFREIIGNIYENPELLK